VASGPILKSSFFFLLISTFLPQGHFAGALWHAYVPTQLAMIVIVCAPFC
jgi:heme exporter protein D